MLYQERIDESSKKTPLVSLNLNFIKKININFNNNNNNSLLSLFIIFFILIIKHTFVRIKKSGECYVKKLSSNSCEIMGEKEPNTERDITFYFNWWQHEFDQKGKIHFGKRTSVQLLIWSTWSCWFRIQCVVIDIDGENGSWVYSGPGYNQ